MKIYLSRIILGIVALMANIAILSILVIGLPLGVVPRQRDVIIALAPIDLIFVICIFFADKEYEEQV